MPFEQFSSFIFAEMDSFCYLCSKFQLRNDITKSDAEDLDNKLDKFLIQANTRKSLMLTLITSFGIKPGKYSGRVQTQVTLEDLFK
jgi:hypothetical protein